MDWWLVTESPRVHWNSLWLFHLGFTQNSMLHLINSSLGGNTFIQIRELEHSLFYTVFWGISPHCCRTAVTGDVLPVLLSRLSFPQNIEHWTLRSCLHNRFFYRVYAAENPCRFHLDTTEFAVDSMELIHILSTNMVYVQNKWNVTYFFHATDLQICFLKNVHSVKWWINYA